jgi:chromosome condensin MukBEF ATPase and DNA-binding subunit MukB
MPEEKPDIETNDKADQVITAKPKKTGTSSDLVNFNADMSTQLKQLREDFEKKNKTDEEKLKALPELNSKLDKLFQSSPVSQEKKKDWITDLFGNFWDGFFD